MSRDYYVFWYRLNNKDGYLIWFSNEIDGFVVDADGFIPSFTEINKLQNYAGKMNLDVNVETPNLIELDPIEEWLNSGKKITNYVPFLNAWNMFQDISNSTDSNFNKDKKNTDEIYERIFWGCNISLVTPEGKSFTPIWTKNELKITRETLNFGFQMLKEKIKQL